MLAAEFEAGETSRPQRVPQFFFLLSLFASETPGVYSGIHAAKRRKTTLKHKPLPMNPLTPSLSPSGREGDRRPGEEASRDSRAQRAQKVRGVLSLSLSPLVPRGEGMSRVRARL